MNVQVQSGLYPQGKGPISHRAKGPPLNVQVLQPTESLSKAINMGWGHLGLMNRADNIPVTWYQGGQTRPEFEAVITLLTRFDLACNKENTIVCHAKEVSDFLEVLWNLYPGDGCNFAWVCLEVFLTQTTYTCNLILVHKSRMHLGGFMVKL